MNKNFLEKEIINSNNMEDFLNYFPYYLISANIYDILGLVKKIFDLSLNNKVNLAKFKHIILRGGNTYLEKLLIHGYALNLLGHDNQYVSLKEKIIKSNNTLISILPKRNVDADISTINNKFKKEYEKGNDNRILLEMLFQTYLDLLIKAMNTNYYSVITNELTDLTFKNIEADMSLLNRVRLLIEYQEDLTQEKALTRV